MNQKKILLRFLLFFFIVFLGQLSFGQVTSETMRQIQSLLDEKSSRTPAQIKMDSRLLQAVRESRGEQMAPGVNLERANVNADNSGTLKVDINGDITNAFLSKITALGGKIIYASAKYHTVRASMNLKTIETLAGNSEVKFVKPAAKYMLVDKKRTTDAALKTDDSHVKAPNLSFEQRAANVRNQLSTYLKKVNSGYIGSVTSQGDAAHRATDVRTTYGYLGQGIKIGVLSDSYNAKSGAAADVTNGDLPGTGNPDGYTTPVTVVQDYSGGDDEGRAMLQVIHDLAPAAILYFATADVSEAGFASNITALRNTYGCNIVLDDVGYFDEAAFQDGICAQAVDGVTSSGGLYFSAAGNSGSLAKGTSGVFEGDFNSTGSATFSGSSKAGTIHNFGTTASPVNGDIITAAGEVYNLTWADPYGASTNDYDLFLISKSGTVKKSSTTVQNGTQDPYEEITPGTLVSGDRLVVFKTAAAAVRAFHLNTNRGTLTVATNGQTTGHACAAGAFCMAATPAATAFESGYPTGPYPGAFVSTNKVEPFSSDGPRKIFYNPDGSAITAGSFTFASGGGSSLSKPDLTAADGVSTTFASSTGLSPFFGTSCAAPHAGAIAALLLSANPSLTAAQVRTILTSTALDIEGTGYDINSGYGIIQAFQAAGQVTASGCGTPTGLSVSSVTTTGATTGWTAVSGATSYTLQYKVSTASSYTAVTGLTTNSYALSSLTAGTKYYFEVLTVCSSGSSVYSALDSFTTTAASGCSAPTGLTVSSVTTTGATTGWTAVSGATSYTLQYKASTASSYTAVTGLTTNSYALSSLTAGTKYYFEVLTVCASGSSVYSALDSFTTTSSAVTYCASSGTTTYEYIKTVVLGTINHTSTNDGGYGNLTSVSTTLAAGTKYTVTLTPGFASTKYAEKWTVYIDYNEDGTLNGTGETVLSLSSAKTGSATGSFTVPTTAKSGSTRIRIQMSYSTASTNPCATITYGDVQDYTANITGGTGSAESEVIRLEANGLNTLSVYPNPTSGKNATASYNLAKEGTVSIKVVDISGRVMHSVVLGSQSAGSHTYELGGIKPKLGAGYYVIVLEQDNKVISRNRFIVAH